MNTSYILPDDQDAPNSLSTKTAQSENPALRYVAGLKSAHSRRNMARCLNDIAQMVSNGRHSIKTFDWAALRFTHTDMIRTALMNSDYSSGTVNLMLSALRGTLRKAWELEQMTAEDFQRAANIKNLKTTRKPAGRDVKFSERKALYEQCGHDQPDQQTLKDKRDAAIIALLHATGMRRAEAARITLENYDRERGKLEIVGGKGDKDRTVFIKNGHKKLLDHWLDVRGDQPGAVFQPMKRRRIDGELVYLINYKPDGLTDQAIYNMLIYRAKAAGLEQFSPHDLRRTFVGDALDAGVDMSRVAQMAGHSSTDTTRRYDRRGERALEAAAALIPM